MKSLLIFILTVAIFAAAFFTRPSPEDCQAMLAKRHANETLAAKLDDFFDRHKYVVKDNYLWVDVSKDGKPFATGAFGHFIARGEGK